MAKCFYCGFFEANTKDHKIPKVKGGGGGSNLVPACKMCNMVKGADDYDYFKATFDKFMEFFGDEYQQANPASMKDIRSWQRRYTIWRRKFFKNITPLPENK